MALFWDLFFKISASFFSILMGFTASRMLQVDKKAIVTILFYLITPIVFFKTVADIKMSFGVLILPLIMFCISSIIAFSFLFFSKKIWHDQISNLVGLSAGTANVGYFALPIAVTLFDENTLGVFIMCMLGVNIFEISLGFFIASIGSFTMRESFHKILKLPTIYAFVMGCIFSVVGIGIPDVFHDFMQDMRSCYVVLGMMIIGFGLAEIKEFKLDFKFIGMTFLAKFIVWPAIICLLILLDKFVFGLYDESIYGVFILISVVPLAANTVSVASLLNCYPEKAAAAVLLSTIFAIFYVPMIAVFFII